MKLGMMLDVDETFTTMRLSRSSEVNVKVRRWPQSLSGLFLPAVFILVDPYTSTSGSSLKGQALTWTVIITVYISRHGANRQRQYFAVTDIACEQ